MGTSSEKFGDFTVRPEHIQQPVKKTHFWRWVLISIGVAILVIVAISIGLNAIGGGGVSVTATKTNTSDTMVSDLAKEGSAWKGMNVHFTATISGLVKDSNGDTAGANVTDGSFTYVQISFPSGTDVSRLNEGDTVEVWGTDGGTQSGQNAFGATIQEVVVGTAYLTDTTTGYQE